MLQKQACSCDICHRSPFLTSLKNEATTTQAFAEDQYEIIPVLNTTLLRRGQEFINENFFSCFVSHLMGLVCILAVNSILKVLILTGGSCSPTKALNRYRSTLLHIKHWYETDSFQQDERSYISIQKVRKIHRFSQKQSEKNFSHTITQLDMTITQWGFVGPLVLLPNALGISKESLKNIDGFIYLWNIIGYLVGMQDKFNLCSGTTEDVYDNCLVVFHQFIKPGLKDPPSQFYSMTYNLVKGNSKLFPLLCYKSFVNFTYSVINLPLPYLEKKWQFICNVLLLQCYFHIPIVGKAVRVLFNGLLRAMIRIQYFHDPLRDSDEFKKAYFDLKYLLFYLTSSVIDTLNNILKRIGLNDGS